MAGEEGPELIVGKAGSTVFPSDETEKIINAISGINEAPVTVADSAAKPVAYQSVTNMGDSYDQSYDAGEVLNRYETSNIFTTENNYQSSTIDDHSISDAYEQSFFNAGDILNKYDAQNLFDNTYTYGDNFTDDHSIGDTIDQSVHNAGDTFNTYTADEADREPPVTSHVLSVDTQETGGSANSGSVETSEKKIIIEIAGNGSIEVSGGGGNEDAILSVLMQNLKPVLMQILRDEIFEEGDESYEY